MFSKKTPNGDGAAAQTDSADGAEGAPALKPFAKPAEQASGQGRSTFHPDVPSRTPDIPGLPPKRGGSDMSRGADAAKTLMVGGAIRLKGGEISNCERLVVEGRVEESVLTDAKRVEILAGGLFKGKAAVEEAIISGRFDGQLTVTSRLTVRETGRISGSVRYGSIVIEPGGEIKGDMQTLSSTGDSSDRDDAGDGDA